MAIEGPSGVGKTTIARALAEAIGAECLPEAYDLIRPPMSLDVRTPEELAALERRLLIVEVERFHASRLALEAGSNVVLDTGCLGPLTYTAGLARRWPAFRPTLADLGREVAAITRSGALGLPTIVVYLDLDDLRVAERAAASSGTHPAEWRARHREVGRWERRLWTRTFARLEPGRLVTVRATGPPEELVARLVRSLSRPGPADPPTIRRTLAVLRAFTRLPDHEGGRRRVGGDRRRAGARRESLKGAPGLAGPP